MLKTEAIEIVAYYLEAEAIENLVEENKKSKLIEMAKALSIKGCSRMNKSELASKLVETVEYLKNIDQQLEQFEVVEAQEEPQEEPQVQPEIPVNPAVTWVNKVMSMQNLEQIKQACEELLTEIGIDNLKTAKSKTNKLRPYTKPFKELKSRLETAHLFYEYTSPNHNKPVVRHVVFQYLGLDGIDWQEEKIKAADRVQKARAEKTSKLDIKNIIESNNNVFNLEKYTETIKSLANTNDFYELALFLIVVSGRRPIEIMLRGQFEILDEYPSYIKYPEYAVKATGLAKKRGKDPSAFISLLIPAKKFVELIDKLRCLDRVQKHEIASRAKALEDCKYSEEQINEKVESKFGKNLRRRTDTYFDFLPKYHEENRKNIILRAIYSKLIALRDYPYPQSLPKGQLIYAGYMTGHLTPIIDENGTVRHNEKDESNLANTLHYNDYDPDTIDIPFLGEDMFNDNNFDGNSFELKAKVATLEVENGNLRKQNELLKEELINLKKEVEALKIKSKEKQPEVSEMGNARLFKTRKKGSTEEKINRVWEAVTAYNDNEPENRIAPTTKILRTLTGVNGNLISDWIKQHETMYSDHMNKYSFSAYYNNRYRNRDISIDQILDTIRINYLELAIA